MSQITKTQTFGWRENCRCCGRISTVGFHVPDHIRYSSIPHRFQDAVLCIACFTLFADEAGVDWSKDITFYPVSLVRHQHAESNGLSHEDIILACKNLGINLDCAGCSTLFFTGHKEAHDVNCYGSVMLLKTLFPKETI